jgi:hypothetical protein
LVAIFTVCPADIRVHYTVQTQSQQSSSLNYIRQAVGHSTAAIGIGVTNPPPHSRT